MKYKNPKITVIIRTYNSEKFVKDAVLSAINQTIKSELFEILAVDDGSKDNTLEILENYKKEIRIIKQNHLGAIKALNNGIKKAKGQYVIILDSDDIFLKDILEKLYSAVKNKKEAAFSCCDYYENVFGEKSKKLISLKNNIFNSVASGFLFRKNILKEMKGYDENLVFPEYDLLIKIQKKYKGIYVPYPLFVYRRHKNSITADKEKVKKGKEELFKKYGKIKGIRKY